jgi:uncharacterized RDD family membrane protein YckC
MPGIESREINTSSSTESSGLDSSLGMQTPEGIEYALFAAGISVRACAWGIDSLIKGIALFVIQIIALYTRGFIGIWIFYLIFFVLDWLYYCGFELLGGGQTPGKRLMGIRVVNGDGTPIRAAASFLRNLLRFADCFFFLYLIAFICMSVSPGFRRIGDWAADTLVIYTARSRLPNRFSRRAQQQAIPWLKDIPAIVPAHKLSYEEKQGLLMFARRYPLLGKNRSDEIARPWATRLRSGVSDDAYTQPNREAEKDSPFISDSEYLLGIAHTISGIL